LLIIGSAFAQEKKITKSELPPTVQKAADEQSKGATVRGYSREMEHGKSSYEVQLSSNGHSKDVSMDADGNVTEIEEQVTMEQLPAEVRQGLQAKVGKGTIKKIESLTKHGAVVAYEAQVVTDGKRSEVQVGPDGKPLDHEE
jgi:uncharacterized membrane protein YkoI